MRVAAGRANAPTRTRRSADEQVGLDRADDEHDQEHGYHDEREADDGLHGSLPLVRRPTETTGPALMMRAWRSGDKARAQPARLGAAPPR